MFRNATDSLLLNLQRRKFSEEIKALQSKKEIKKTSRLKFLTPYFDDNGLLLVYGRLQRSSLPDITKHGRILDSNDNLTPLMINETRVTNSHIDAQHTLHVLRRKYLIIHGLSVVKQQILRCWTCQKQRKPLMM